MLTHPWVEHQHPKSRPSSANTFGVGRSISQLQLGPLSTNTFWRFLRHIGIILDLLGDVDIPMGRASAPRPGPHWANIWGSGEVNISASIRAPCTNFLDAPETHRNIYTPLGRCWHTCRQGTSTQNQAKLSKYMAEGEVNISASIRAPWTKYIFGSS